ncbi:aldose 1-epimerase family protein [Paraglaciecola aquimarina]|uniref:Aldose 1-epimerase family protein n=1 Tax=Paraglaciecola aquimarina TaxID=1235557 RepID=A0ABU3STF6_9ALTE|nr:aldose 1-epimerase family protein [Paraglaciecola aquimarina]MDU0353286.1 aldose 1-epimerase family protein [Paraglaciecola aquimarina]
MNPRSQYSISNSLLTCTISELGAEIVSLKSQANGDEYIWQGDPAIWAGSAPILFPIVGRLKNGKYSVDGQEYALPTHGFINNQYFTLVEKTRSSITLRVKANQATLLLYPFRFQFDVTFSLEQKSLSVTYEISNSDDTELYFSIGSHPAFALPMTEFRHEKCKLRFSEQENQYCQLIKNELLSEQTYSVELTAQTLTLTADLFARDALIFRDICSSSITLLIDDVPVLALEMGNNRHLGLWAKPNSPYICLEPWTATDETETTPTELKLKPDMLCLSSGATYSNYYRIDIF